MGKKAKKGKQAAQDSDDEQAQGQPSAGGGAKQKGRRDDGDEDEEASTSARPAQAGANAAGTSGKGKGKKGKGKKGRGKHDDMFSDDEGQPEAPAESESAPAESKSKQKKAKRAAKAGFGALQESGEDNDAPAAEEDTVVDENLLLIVEVFEARSHPKLAAHQKLVTLFDGDNMYKVVCEHEEIQQDDLVVLAKHGCVLPGSQKRVTTQKVSGIKSEGQLCTAFDVGWITEETEELLVLDESWNLISGDTCPMSPPLGWQQAHEPEPEDDGGDEVAGSSKPGANAFAGLDGDSGEEDAASTDEEEEVALPDQKKAAAANAFAGLGGDTDDDEEEEEEEESEEEAKPAPSAKKGKDSKKAAAMNAFAGLGDDSDESDESDEEAAPVPAPAPSKLQTKTAGKKKNEKQAAAANAFAGLGDDSDEDSDESEDEAPAAPSKGKKAAAAANAFAGLGDDDDDDDDDEEEEETSPPPSTSKKDSKKKSKKSAAAMNAFAGLGDDDDSDEDEQEEEASPPRSKAKSKNKKSAANAFAGLMGDDDDSADEAAHTTPQAATAKAQGKGGKKQGKKSKGEAAEADEDLDSLLASVTNGNAAAKVAPAEVPIQDMQSVEAVQAAMDAPGVSKTRMQKLKQRLKHLQDEAVLAELEAPTTSAAAAEAPVDSLTTVEAVQAAMDTPNVSKTRLQKLKQRLKQLQGAEQAGEQKGEGEGDTVESVQKALEAPGLNANQKKKLKAKLKKLQDKEAAEKAEPKKGKKGGPSAAVLAMQREVEERRRREEEAARAAEEAARLAEEEARAAEEAERLAAEEAERRAEEKRKRKEELRQQGKLLSKKEKEAERRRELARQRLLQQAQEKGIDPNEMLEKANKKPVYVDKKKQLKQKQKEAEEQRAREAAERDAADKAAAEARAAEDAMRKVEEEAKRKAEEEAKAAEEAAADNWEDEVVEDWDADSEEAADTTDKGAVAGDAQAEGDVEMEEDDDEDDEDDEDDSEEDSSEEWTDSESEYSTDSEEARERLIEEARRRREERFQAAMEQRSKDDLRSPICCILGHVDTGKTKILDNIRRTNVQLGEAGGITQQIGATYIPADAVKGRTDELRGDKAFDMKMPGLLVIDTPGHESFSNLRSRGSSLCDIAVLVVDIMHGLEQQTIESINLLKMRKSPFIVALNKIDRMYDWQAHTNAPVRSTLAKQKAATQAEFERRCDEAMLALTEQGLNVELYWKNKDPRRFINIVPTSAITGEGICDLMWLIVKLTQNMMMDRLMFMEELQCTVLEVKVVEGYGHTIDAVLINGRIREGDQVVICGLQGPIVTTIRSLLTPHPLKELRVKNAYIHHKEIKAAQGIKIAAPNLENAVAGTQLYVTKGDDAQELEELRSLVMEDMSDIFDRKEPEGVCVQASTLGSLEALLEFLGSDAVQIPVSGLNIGPVHKKDVMRANIMSEKKLKKYSCILAFDVPVTREAQALATSLGVTIFTADIIYHLFDMFTEYTKRCKEQEKDDAKLDAVFPCRMKILPNCVFNAKDPIVVGCEVLDGQLRVGTPITVPERDFCDLGRVATLQKDHKNIDKAEKGDSIAVKIESTNATEASRLFGRHFGEQDELMSKITRESINALKAHFRDEMTRPDWELIIRMKKVFKID